jgi:PhzF family phenazine biosynthesis protein
MMQLPLYQVDAFAGRLFAGNPAAVCPLDRWLPDQTMQAIAAENNLSETAFFVPSADGFDLRWFTPTVETDLCGHATLASGFVVMTALAPERSAVRFHTKSGPLEVTRQGDRFALSLPAQPGQLCPVPQGLTEALGRAPRQMLAARKYLAIFDEEADVAAIQPDLAVIARLDRDGLIISAPGREVDFVSRYFAPHAGIPEDPVTGSAHCTLVPYWSKRLGKKQLTARQISPRGGELACEDRGDRVVVSGRAVLYLEGRIHV